jgi:hypothetical protein
MSLRACVVSVAIACLPAAAFAGNPQLRLPAFDHLQRSATECVNITIGHGLLSLATFALKHDEPRDEEALEVLRGIESITVRSYEFDADGMYSKADIDSVRAQLTSPGWSPLAQVRQRTQGEDVDVYVSLDHDKVNGLAVVASSARKFTIVNIVGTIDPSKLAILQDRLGLPGRPM